MSNQSELIFSFLSCEEEHADRCQHNAADDEVHGGAFAGGYGSRSCGAAAVAGSVGLGAAAVVFAAAVIAGVAVVSSLEAGLVSAPVELCAGVLRLLDLLLNLREAQTEGLSGIVDGLLLSLAVELGSILDALVVGRADESIEHGDVILTGPIGVADDVTDRGDGQGVAVVAALPLNHIALLVGVNVVLDLVAGAISGVAEAVKMQL